MEDSANVSSSDSFYEDPSALKDEPRESMNIESDLDARMLFRKGSRDISEVSGSISLDPDEVEHFTELHKNLVDSLDDNLPTEGIDEQLFKKITETNKDDVVGNLLEESNLEGNAAKKTEEIAQSGARNYEEQLTSDVKSSVRGTEDKAMGSAENLADDLPL